MTICLSLLNALLKYDRTSLRLQVREKITRWCHRMLMREDAMIFYSANRLSDRIEHCDHQISSDVDRFSQVFAEVVSQSLKPAVDFLVYSVELSRVQGLATPATLYAWFGAASLLSAQVAPPFGALAAREQSLEGRFRFRHSELILGCEQIAFLRGAEPERRGLEAALEDLLAHLRRSNALAFPWEVLRQYANKYFVTVIGLLLVSRPLRASRAYSSDVIAEYFSSTWRNMEAMASSIQDLFELSDRAACLGGLALRLSRLMARLAAPALPSLPLREAPGGLRLQKVSVAEPRGGTVLIRDLSLAVERGQRVLVTGPNGCGKSGLFRVLCGLWPLRQGSVVLPPREEIHVVPQHPFVPCGTLRDLVIYPASLEEARRAGRTDGDVHTCLVWAHVSPRVVADGRAQLELRDHGLAVRPRLDDTRDWQKELSPGQKQRIAFARLFFHRPSFVVLDECTNGVSPDVEHELYDRCARMHMGVFSISHKLELRLFHDVELHCKGDAEGSWTMSRCSEVRDEGKVMFSSAAVRHPEPTLGGKNESRITYERHVWFVE